MNLSFEVVYSLVPQDEAFECGLEATTYLSSVVAAYPDLLPYLRDRRSLDGMGGRSLRLFEGRGASSKVCDAESDPQLRRTKPDVYLSLCVPHARQKRGPSSHFARLFASSSASNDE